MCFRDLSTVVMNLLSLGAAGGSLGSFSCSIRSQFHKSCCGQKPSLKVQDKAHFTALDITSWYMVFSKLPLKCLKVWCSPLPLLPGIDFCHFCKQIKWVHALPVSFSLTKCMCLSGRHTNGSTNRSGGSAAMFGFCCLTFEEPSKAFK